MKTDQWFGLVLLAGSLFVAFVLGPDQINGTDAKIFPYVALGLTGGFSLGLICNRNPANDSPGFAHLFTASRSNRQLALTILLLFIYYVAVDIVGFYLPSGLLVGALLFLFGTHNPLWYAAFPVLFCLLVYGLIDVLLAFPMPTGLLI